MHMPMIVRMILVWSLCKFSRRPKLFGVSWGLIAQQQPLQPRHPLQSSCSESRVLIVMRMISGHGFANVTPAWLSEGARSSIELSMGACPCFPAPEGRLTRSRERFSTTDVCRVKRFSMCFKGRVVISQNISSHRYVFFIFCLTYFLSLEIMYPCVQ